jgi:hypothetical protein
MNSLEKMEISPSKTFSRHGFSLLFFFIVAPFVGENMFEHTFGELLSQCLAAASCLLILIMCLYTNFDVNFFIFVSYLLLLEHLMVFLPALLSDLVIESKNGIISPDGLAGFFMFILLINICCKLNKTQSLFKSTAYFLTIVVFLNFFLTQDFKFPDFATEIRKSLATGYMDRKWIVGHRNVIFTVQYMWILFMGLYYKTSNRNYTKMFIFQTVVTFLIGIYSWNVTMLVCISVLFVLYMFLGKYFSIWHYTFIYLFIDIGVVIFRITDSFSTLFVSVLKRNVTFSGRVELWDIYIDQYLNGSLSNLLFGNFGVTHAFTNTHNMLLGLLCYSGVVGLLLFVLLYVMSANSLHKIKNNNLSRFISMILFIVLINSITMEFYLQPLFILFLGYKSRDLINRDVLI